MTKNKFKNKNVVILLAIFCMFLWGSAVRITKIS